MILTAIPKTLNKKQQVNVSGGSSSSDSSSTEGQTFSDSDSKSNCLYLALGQMILWGVVFSSCGNLLLTRLNSYFPCVFVFWYDAVLLVCLLVVEPTLVALEIDSASVLHVAAVSPASGQHRHRKTWVDLSLMKC